MKKYKIVVLTNLGRSTKATLKSAISLAKIINGEIEVFSVKKPTELVNRESQLSAIRSIYDQRVTLKKKMQELTEKMSKEYGIKIKSSLAFGNVKNEIADFIEERKPDIVVLGKRKAKVLTFIGDNVGQFVFDTFKGAIMVASEKSALEPDKELFLGMLNNFDSVINLEFGQELMGHTQEPLKSFKFAKNSSLLKSDSEPSNKKKVEYVFENSDSSYKRLANYLSKNNINMLYMDRVEKQTEPNKNLARPDVTDLINKLDVTLLVAGQQ